VIERRYPVRPLHSVLFGSILILVSVGIASGQSSEPAASGAVSSSAQSGATVEGKKDAQPEAQMQSATSVEADVKTDAKAEAALKAIRARGKSAPAKTRAAVEKKLDQISGEVDESASTKGKEVAAGRVAPEFGMTGEALLAEETQFNTSLGQLVIAHTLLANAKTSITLEQLFSMRHDGMGWGQIAHGLDLRLGDVVSAVRSESNVAEGTAKADGKAAMIHRGAHVGARAGTGAAVQAGHAGVGAAGNAGVGVKVGK
jgi:hypothetical protein